MYCELNRQSNTKDLYLFFQIQREVPSEIAEEKINLDRVIIVEPKEQENTHVINYGYEFKEGSLEFFLDFKKKGGKLKKNLSSPEDIPSEIQKVYFLLCMNKVDPESKQFFYDLILPQEQC